MNLIELVQVSDNIVEIEMTTFKQMLYQIHLLKPKGVHYNRFTNRWACPMEVVPQLKQSISSLAQIVEAAFEPTNKKIKLLEEQSNYVKGKKIIVLSHFNQYQLAVKILPFDADIVSAIKEIKGSYFQKPYWLIATERLEELQNILIEFKEYTLEEKLDTVG